MFNTCQLFGVKVEKKAMQLEADVTYFCNTITFVTPM
ncbi:MAG: hypothetical protein H6Q64_313 [Firmicutes bacterium]|nr:hypothetical protein [Bacillota bacterium]